MIEQYGTLVLEFLSAILILIGFEFFNRKSIKGFYIMACGQFLAAIICAFSALWFLSFMHFINFWMQIRGYISWKKKAVNEDTDLSSQT